MQIIITTSQSMTYNYFIPDRTSFSVDYYIDLVCKQELCPKSAIRQVKINDLND